MFGTVNTGARASWAGDTEALKAVEDEVDQVAAELWDITDEELAEIRRNLEELRE